MFTRISRSDWSRRGSWRFAYAIIGLLVTGGLAMPAQAPAISSDYCGGYYGEGVQCFAGGGYQPWRYHKGSTNGVVQVNALCVQSWTGSNYRQGSTCWANTTAYSFCNYYATPNANSSVSWGGGPNGNTYRLYGRADDSLNHTGITQNYGC